MEKLQKLSTESYKGVRDFYPEDKFIQDYIFGVWKKTAESFGYVAYDASILEPTELYKAKSGEEIVNEQTYSFKDRGDRDVTIRPEMTPTVARMIAGRRRELKFPQRWYSIPNLFRYERMQRGRLREHWQLNCDMFGLSGTEAEVEMISMAYRIMRNFNISDDKFEIKIGSRKIFADKAKELNLSEENSTKLQKLVDKKSKMSAEDFEKKLFEIAGVKEFSMVPDLEVNGVISKLAEMGIKNVSFNAEVVRGFDYYTGITFEIFDKNPENNRSIFGGGRYDNLLSIFGEEPIPTIGFGMGDVVIRDVLETYGLLPEYKSTTTVALLPFESTYFSECDSVANTLRNEGINVAVDYSDKKVGDKIGKADKEKIKYVIVIGEDEVNKKAYKLKELETKNEVFGTLTELIVHIKKS